VVADPEVGVGVDRAASLDGVLAEGCPGGQAGRVAGGDLGDVGGAGGGGEGVERPRWLLDGGLVGLASRPRVGWKRSRLRQSSKKTRCSTSSASS
jgi:hypothetical protein